MAKNECFWRNLKRTGAVSTSFKIAGKFNDSKSENETDFQKRVILRVSFDSIWEWIPDFCFPFVKFAFSNVPDWDNWNTLNYSSYSRRHHFSVKIHYLQIKNESKTVWFSLNQSAKSFVNLKSSLQSLKKKVSNLNRLKR